MWTFAWRNLLTRPLRTILALVGLSIPILGVVGLFSLSAGLRNLVGDTLSQIQGLMVLRENAPSPVFSDLPADMEPQLREVPGVSAVAPSVWKVAPQIENVHLFTRVMGGMGTLMARPDPKAQPPSDDRRTQSPFDVVVIQGQDIPAHADLQSAVYPRALLPADQGGGRFLTASDQGQPNIVISTKIAKDFPITEEETGETRPRRVGDTLRIGGKPFTIIGLYETRSLFLDNIVIMDIHTARQLLGLSEEIVSSYYIEAHDPSRIQEVAFAIEQMVAGVDARTMEEFSANFGILMGHLDAFLLMTVSLALIVGVVGIVNTMLMSTTERFVEFGVLRTNGWSQANVLSLVTLESAYLGLLAGIAGCLMALAGAAVANQFLTGGLQLTISSRLLAGGIALSVITGTLGGLYPAWRAARLVPMDAIRLGSH